MSNKRIDLTQFEGITEGPWEYEMLTLVTAYPHPAITINQTGDDLRLRLGKVSCPQDGKAMAKLPDLIAELKRCYEEIDTFHPLHGLEVWDEDPDYSRAEWREEVADGHVTSGYWRWVSNQYLASE